MGSIRQPDLENILNKISLRENIINPKTEYKYGNEKGVGYLGIIKAIELNGKNKKIGLILKSAPDSDKLRDQAPIREAFTTEIYFYETIIPAFKKFQFEYAVKNPFDSTPKCFATVNNPKEELLILENLRNEGYDLWNRKETMNSEHIKFVMKQYGKFHATSLAMKDKNKEMFQELTSKLIDPINLFWEKSNMTKLLGDMSNNLKLAFDPETESAMCEKFTNFFENVEKNNQDTAIVDEFAVIIHGDCWCNNMMFRYKDPLNTKKPESMNLIDFQLSKLASPVIDLSYFFYVCVSKESMKILNYYLRIYHESLSDHLKEFGCNAEDIFSFETLLNQWKKYSKFGLIMSVFIIKIMLSDSDEAPDLSDAAENTNDILSSFGYESRREEEYRQRFKDVFCHFYDNKFI